MPKRFRRIQAGIDVAALLDEIDVQPEIWKIDSQRQLEVAVQRETEAVPVFAHAGEETFREARQRHPIGYRGAPTAVAACMPRTRAFVDALAHRLHGRPGRVAIVRLSPHGRVYPHVDRGLYYQLRDRYHLVLQSRVGSRLRAESEEIRMQEGELWWFDNRLPHEAFNDADEFRIHLIMDVLSPRSVGRFIYRTLFQPRTTLDALRRRVRKTRKSSRLA